MAFQFYPASLRVFGLMISLRLSRCLGNLRIEDQQLFLKLLVDVNLSEEESHLALGVWFQFHGRYGRSIREYGWVIRNSASDSDLRFAACTNRTLLDASSNFSRILRLRRIRSDIEWLLDTTQPARFAAWLTLSSTCFLCSWDDLAGDLLVKAQGEGAPKSVRRAGAVRSSLLSKYGPRVVRRSILRKIRRAQWVLEGEDFGEIENAGTTRTGGN